MLPDYGQILIDALSKPGSASSDFDLNPDIALPVGRVLKPAAVLVGVRENGNVILTKRSARLKHHPGQIAFPGGKKDEGDVDLIAAALREAHEEIGLPSDQVEVLGSLPCHETVTNYTVSPIVGLIMGNYDVLPEVGEVSDVFEVPFSHFANLENFRIEGRRWQGNRRQYFVAPYGPYYIWGATARIFRALADRVAL